MNKQPIVTRVSKRPSAIAGPPSCASGIWILFPVRRTRTRGCRDSSLGRSLKPPNADGAARSFCCSKQTLGPLRASLSDLDDRAVEDGPGFSNVDHALLLQFVDLVVANDQDRAGTGLPG